MTVTCILETKRLRICLIWHNIFNLFLSRIVISRRPMRMFFAQYMYHLIQNKLNNVKNQHKVLRVLRQVCALPTDIRPKASFYSFGFKSPYIEAFINFLQSDWYLRTCYRAGGEIRNLTSKVVWASGVHVNVFIKAL